MDQARSARVWRAIDAAAGGVELQFTLGQGPATDVALTGAPERVADVTGREAGRRWPVFLHEVIDAAFTARRAEVHQAAGRIAAQNGIGVADALARLRAHAYGTGQSLREVAADVMTGGLRLDTDHETQEDLG